MKLNFLKIKTKSFLKKNRAQRSNLPYDHARTIGIIFTVEDKQKHQVVKDFIRHFEQDGKQVQVLEYLPEKKDNYEFKFDFFTEKDISLWGNITSTNALAFADAPFDFLFYLDLTPNPMILHLLARSKAKCRVGRSWDDGHDYFELMIESVNNNQALFDTMYKYTTQLK